MSYQKFAPQVRENKWREPEVLTTAYEVVDKKSGEVLPIYKGYIEISGQLYKFEISNRNSPTKKGGNAKWVKFTKKAKRTQSTQRF